MRDVSTVMELKQGSSFSCERKRHLFTRGETLHLAADQRSYSVLHDRQS